MRPDRFVREFLGAAYEHGSNLRHRQELRTLQRFHASSPDRQRAACAASLHGLVRDVASSANALPAWREAARIDDPDELLATWSELPVMDRELLRDRFEPRPLEVGRRGRITSSSGTSGRPVRVWHDPAMLRAARAKASFARRRLGWRPGMPVVALWGSPRDLGFSSSRLRAAARWASNTTLLAGYRIDDDLVDRFVGIVRRAAPVAVYGYTSILAEVARRVMERGLSLPPGAVAVAWNGAEELRPEHRGPFREAFGVELHDWYGTRELNAVACQFDDDGPLTVLGPFDYLEVVDDAGRPVGAGGEGRILVTSTACRGTPLVRYQVGDRGVVASTIPGVDGVRTLARVVGRGDQTFVASDGTMVNALFWSSLLRRFERIRGFQVVLEPDDRITILVTLSDGGDAAARALERQIAPRVEHLCRPGALRVERVDAIERTVEGKLLPVVDHRSP